MLNLGWRVLEVWECTLRGKHRWPVEGVLQDCARFLESGIPLASIGTDQTVTVDAPE